MRAYRRSAGKGLEAPSWLALMEMLTRELEERYDKQDEYDEPLRRMRERYLGRRPYIHEKTEIKPIEEKQIVGRERAEHVTKRAGVIYQLLEMAFDAEYWLGGLKRGRRLGAYQPI